MKTRITVVATALAILAVMAGSARSAFGQDVTLRYRWTKGEEVKQRFVQQSVATISGVPGGAGEMTIDTSMSQAFQLISGPGMHELLSATDNRIGKLLKAKVSTNKIIDELYWSALSRPPTEPEIEKCLAYVRDAKDARRALEDLTWALMNSKEFVLRK